MSNLVKTTIMIPEDLLQQAKLYAVRNKTTLSNIARTSIKEAVSKGKTKKPKKKSVLTLAGRLNLKGKPPPSRRELYGIHIKRKLGM